MQQAIGEPASIFDIISILEEQSPMKLKLWVGCRVQYARRTGMTLQLAASSTKPGIPANHFVHDTYWPHEIPVWLSMLSNLSNAANQFHRVHHETAILLPICNHTTNDIFPWITITQECHMHAVGFGEEPSSATRDHAGGTSPVESTNTGQKLPSARP